MFSQLIDHFAKQTPISMMIHGLLERALPDDGLQRLFNDYAVVQYERKLLFSDIVELMSVVVCPIRPSIQFRHQKLA